MPIKKVSLTIQFQYEINNIIKLIIPNESLIYSWIYLIIKQHYKDVISKYVTITIRFVEYKEIYMLNSYFRSRYDFTNILSFPYENPPTPKIKITLLGELVITPILILYEALKKNKAFIAHFAHILIHGCLHLLGHSHNNYFDADKMDNLEHSILNQVNLHL
ncbi:rRNA maturation factor YbeY [Candidatus Portiera aleyrodidarum]|uniref:Endoribonuclease YbeY n=1 Tax=Candidatus Portiera aleyrodidarum TaxID=91844 RepID=A0A6S6S4R2_9GAMM|nr:rRNA maturation RNase YbeY [Candidatus Portiera aleyrodidarum]CAA3706715.1 rRNA maturation factor YbeY [Candidatus Portiera aleyrodidarum]